MNSSSFTTGCKERSFVSSSFEDPTILFRSFLLWSCDVRGRTRDAKFTCPIGLGASCTFLRRFHSQLCKEKHPSPHLFPLEGIFFMPWIIFFNFLYFFQLFCEKCAITSIQLQVSPHHPSMQQTMNHQLHYSTSTTWYFVCFFDYKYL